MLRPLLSVLLLLATLAVNAQNYHYQYRNSGNPLNMGSASVLNNSEDVSDENTGAWNLVLGKTDEYSSAIFIPFAFQFNGNAETALKASPTGFITFDTSVSGSAPAGTYALPNGALPSKTVSILGMASTGDNDKILTRSFGVAPNRQFWIKFASLSTPGDTTSSFNYWSIVLEESTQKIFVVGMYFNQTFNEYQSPNHSIGLQLNNSNAISVKGSPAITNKVSGKNPGDNFYYEFIPGSALLYDAELQLKNSTAVLKSGENMNVDLSISNLGQSTIDSLSVAYSVNGGAPVKARYSAMGILPSAESLFSLSLTPVNNAGTAGTAYVVKIWVSQPNNSNESNFTNDTVLTTAIVSANSGVLRRILVESGTAAWCGDCPVADVNLYQLQKQYNDTVIVVRHHSADNMSSNSDELNQMYLNILPEAMLNRASTSGTKAMAIDSLQAKITNSKGATAPASVAVSNVVLNETSGKLTYKVKAIFTDYYYGNLSVGGMVLEDNVRGSGTGFSQTVGSKYILDSKSPFYRSVNPIAGYYNQSVVWNLNGGIWGVGSGVAAVYKPGDSIVQTFEYTFPQLLKKINLASSPYLPVGDIFSLGKPADIKALGYLADNSGDKFIVNSAVKSLWDTALSAGDIVKNTGFDLYPNPTTGYLQLKIKEGNYRLQIHTADGKAVYSNSFYSNGIFGVDLNSISANGIYILRLENESGFWTTKQFVLAR
ncbi:MAG: T9SS type A sorting domain-containing protein [Bacteroidia bacterium]|nr:T9SS type A sorting domain-containing protein [Bacteroidia bacterium]